MATLALDKIDLNSNHALQGNEADDIIQSIRRDIQCLTDQNKVARRRALERLIKNTLDKVPPLSCDILSEIYKCLFKPVLKLFSDEVDRTRELAVDLTSRFFPKLNETDQYLSYIIPTIHKRLVADEIIEATEEIRLQLIEVLLKIIEICAANPGNYINEIVQVLQVTITDPFSDVRKSSCLCTDKLASIAPQKFYEQGESLIDPLIKSLPHQHNKVRSVVLKTIGVVVLATSGKAVNDVFNHIAQRIFDNSPSVRLVVSEVAGEWLLKLRDRYSFFQKLIPLLLSGFSDEMPEIRERSYIYFKEAGKLYEEENEAEFKEEKEYHVSKHFEHLIEHVRPILGCRVLIQRNFSKILPAIQNDITDWTVSARIKSASLLYWLVYYCEDHITMHMQLLSQVLYRGVQDEENMVVVKVIETACLVGLFVEPSIYCKLILPYLESSSAISPVANYSGLSILGAYIKGANYYLLDSEIQTICSTLGNPDICSMRDKKSQEELLKCIDEIISKTGINHSLISCILFKILLNVFALACTDMIKENIHRLMDKLSKMINFKDRYCLFECYASEILSRLKDTCDIWTIQSPDCLIFISLLSESGRSLESLLSSAMPIFIQCCNVSKDTEMRQKIITLMSQIVTKPMDVSLRIMFQVYSLQLISDVILPNCVWYAGRVAAAIRAVAVSFLWALLQAQIITNDHLKECFKGLHTQLIACLDDFNETTRSVTVKVMLKLLQVCKGVIESDVLHVIYPEVLKRMDDSSDDIRITTAKVICTYFDSLPLSYDKNFYQLHLEFIYRTMLIHLDDQNEMVQEACLVSLKAGVVVHPGLLKQKVLEVMHKHRRRQFCEKLLHDCECLIQRNKDSNSIIT